MEIPKRFGLVESSPEGGEEGTEGCRSPEEEAGLASLGGWRLTEGA